MKYFKNADGQVYAFETDGSQDEFILPELVVMSEEQVNKHLNPSNYLSDEEKRALMPSLTRRKFKLALQENKLLDLVETTINSIENDTVKKRMQIEYAESIVFERTSPVVIQMCELLGLTPAQVDFMWVQAQSL